MRALPEGRRTAERPRTAGRFACRLLSLSLGVGLSHFSEAAGRGLERDPFLPVARNRLPRSRGQGFEGGEPPFPRAHGAGGGPIRSRKWLARLRRVPRRAVRRARPWPELKRVSPQVARRVWLESSAGRSRFLSPTGAPPRHTLPDTLCQKRSVSAACRCLGRRSWKSSFNTVYKIGRMSEVSPRARPPRPPRARRARGPQVALRPTRPRPGPSRPRAGKQGGRSPSEGGWWWPSPTPPLPS